MKMHFLIFFSGRNVLNHCTFIFFYKNNSSEDSFMREISKCLFKNYSC